MGQSLFEIFLEREITNISVVLINDGINSILRAYENWLVAEHYLKRENGSYQKFK